MRTTHSAPRIALTLLALFAGLPVLRAQTDSDDIQALRAQVTQLDQQLRILERKLELATEASAAAAKNTPVVSIGKKGLVISSPDGNFSLKIGALVQTDARFYLDDSASSDGFLLRRVRLPVGGTVYKDFSFFLQPEFSTADNAGSNTQLVDAWAQVQLAPWLSLKAGKFFGPVALETPNNRHFIEASYTNQIAPNRDLGFEAGGSLAGGIVSYRLGVYNGAPNNVWSATTNTTNGNSTFGGRLTVNPFGKTEGLLAPLSLSIGGTIGQESGTNTAIKSDGQQTIVNSYAVTGQQIRISPALDWYTGPFSVVVEFSADHQQLALNGEGITNTAWKVESGYVLTGENSTRKGVSPASPFSWTNGAWGAFEIVARVSGLNVDNKLFDSGVLSRTGKSSSASQATSYGVGLNWFLNDNVEALFDVGKGSFSGGSANSSNVVLRDGEAFFFTRLQFQL